MAPKRKKNCTIIVLRVHVSSPYPRSLHGVTCRGMGHRTRWLARDRSLVLCRPDETIFPFRALGICGFLQAAESQAEDWRSQEAGGRGMPPGRCGRRAHGRGWVAVRGCLPLPGCLVGSAGPSSTVEVDARSDGHATCGYRTCRGGA
jgi:hypothetical protein